MSKRLKSFKLPDPSDPVWPGDVAAGVAPYLLSDTIITTLKVALVTDRPLLISGPPGCGKTTLARAVAHAQGWSFLKHTLTSRSRLEDLTCDMDQLQRLHDAQAARASGESALKPEWAYLKPGLIWWGFDAASAKRKGRTDDEIEACNTKLPHTTPPKGLKENSKGLVILLDEIDKAEPDLPNDLLEALDELSISLPDGAMVKAPDQLTVLAMITTNRERELPQAFLRRCVHLELASPDKATLKTIADHHFSENINRRKTEIFDAVADKFLALAKETERSGRRPPGTSEYLDAVRACLELGIRPDEREWQQVEQATLSKQPKAGGSV